MRMISSTIIRNDATDTVISSFLSRRSVPRAADRLAYRVRVFSLNRLIASGHVLQIDVCPA